MVPAEQSGRDCPICAKHRGEGPLVGPKVWEDDLVLVSHRAVDESGTAVLGYLFVEPRRHAPYLADLTDTEAEAIGRTVRRAAVGLRAELHPDFVFSAIIGVGVPHFHQHVFVRHAGTPAEYDWDAGGQWPGAVRGTRPVVEGLCRRLRTHLDADPSPGS